MALFTDVVYGCRIHCKIRSKIRVDALYLSFLIRAINYIRYTNFVYLANCLKTKKCVYKQFYKKQNSIFLLKYVHKIFLKYNIPYLSKVFLI